MILDSGMAILFRYKADSGRGNMAERESEEFYRGYYGDRIVGFSRFYTAQQANTRIDKLIRMHRPPRDVEIRASDMCVLADNHIYRIKQAQFVRDEDGGFDAVDLSLERIGEKYESARSS